VNRRQALLTAGAVLVAAPVAASAARLGRGATWTPLSQQGGAVFTVARINGQPVDVTLDSGASLTVLDQALASRLGVPALDSAQVAGMSGAAQAGQYAGAFRLELAEARIEFPPGKAVILDLSGLRPGGRAVEALVGRELFEATRLDLDFPHGRLASGSTPPPEAVRLALTREAEQLRAAPVSLDGRPEIQATFDLGAGLPFQVSRDWARANGLMDGRRTSEWFLTGVEGVSTYTTLTLPRLNLGGFEFHDVPIGVVDGQPEGSSPALLGIPVWRRFRLFSDFAADSLWLTPDPTLLKTPFNRDRSGLGLQFVGDALEVVLVARGSPAEAGGWRVGERVVAVNGRRIDFRWPGSRASAWARGKAGSSVSLQPAEGPERQLVLADYY
jgi:predicted aspartyl protease